MDTFLLPLFLLNTLLILGDASLGYHLAPRLLEKLGDNELSGQSLRPTRSVLTLVVAGYMFFNCRGYFQGNPANLLAVLGLVLADMLLQLWLARRAEAQHNDDDGE